MSELRATLFLLAVPVLTALAIAPAPATAHEVDFGGSKTRIRTSAWISPPNEASDRPPSAAGTGAAAVVYGGRQEASYFDPSMGRFTSRDPLYDWSNLGSQYAFVGNSPLSRTDPFGLIDPELLRLPEKQRLAIANSMQCQLDADKRYGTMDFETRLDMVRDIADLRGNGEAWRARWGSVGLKATIATVEGTGEALKAGAIVAAVAVIPIPPPVAKGLQYGGALALAYGAGSPQPEPTIYGAQALLIGKLAEGPCSRMPAMAGFSDAQKAMLRDSLKALQDAGYDTSLFKQLNWTDYTRIRGMSLPDGAALSDKAFTSPEMLNHVLEEELRHLEQKQVVTEFGPDTADALEKDADVAPKFPEPKK